MHRRLAAVVLQALILISLVGAGAAWSALDRRVTILLDGTPRSVRTHAATVGEVLERSGIAVGRHDLLAPDRDVVVEDGSYVVVRRGRPVTINVDGRDRRVWVTARSVDELLGQIGLRDRRVWLSASRSRQIPLGGLSLNLRLPKQATVVADGRPAVVITTVPTVRDLFALTQVTLSARDRTSVPLETPLTDGIVVSVTRIDGSLGVVSVPVPQPVIRRPDRTRYTGETEVVDPGAPGVVVQTWAYTLTDGRVTAQRLVSQVARSAPRPEIISVGTRPRPRHAPSADGLNWPALAECESGGDPTAYNPAGPYYGLYQFSASTWYRVGGTGLPSDASPDEQTYRAQLLYRRSGAGQWPVCGHYLFT